MARRLAARYKSPRYSRSSSASAGPSACVRRRYSSFFLKSPVPEYHTRQNVGGNLSYILYCKLIWKCRPYFAASGTLVHLCYSNCVTVTPYRAFLLVTRQYCGFGNVYASMSNHIQMSRYMRAIPFARSSFTNAFGWPRSASSHVPRSFAVVSGSRSPVTFRLTTL
jgi:hypothetical protein